MLNILSQLICNIINFLSNPSIIAAFIGAFSAWCFSFFSNHYKYNKQKNGIYSILKSEIIFIINSLKNYQMECLKSDIPQDMIDYSEGTLSSFYLNCNAFPNFSKFIWKELIDFLPDFFSPDELNKIVSFYYAVEELKDDANFFSSKETFTRVYDNEGRYVFNFAPDLVAIHNQRKIFREKLLKTIGEGNSILNFFN